MQDYQQRVIDEKKELDDKLNKLVAFIAAPKFHDIDHDEQVRMIQQRRFMHEYSRILGERIDNFKP